MDIDEKKRTGIEAVNVVPMKQHHHVVKSKAREKPQKSFLENRQDFMDRSRVHTKWGGNSPTAMVRPKMIDMKILFIHQ